MTLIKNDPWREFRNEKGEFKRWLHMFVIGRKNTTFLDVGYFSGPLPWVLRGPLDGESLIAMYNIGMTARWPADWPRFKPASGWNCNIYGILMPTPSKLMLRIYLEKLEKQYVCHSDLIKLLDSRYVLFPQKKESVNANS